MERELQHKAVMKQVRRANKPKRNFFREVEPSGRVRYFPGALKKIGKEVGGLLPGPLGELGRKIGGKAGAYLASIIGHGDYRISKPVRMNTVLSGVSHYETGVPRFRSSRGGGTRIRHREYLQDIAGTTAFTLTSWNINPGLSTTFPWLSQVAQAYEEYKIHGLVFEFISTSADALSSTNTNLGTVMMATEYDVLDAVFTTKQQMLAYEFAISGRPSCNLIHGVECEPRQTPLTEQYVRTGAAPAGADLRLYDLGLFQLATSSQQAATTGLGELWISYDIEFFKPKLVGGEIGLSINYTNMSILTGCAAATPLGTVASWAYSPATTMTPNTSACTSTIWAFPAEVIEGCYMLCLEIAGSGSVTIGTPTVTLVNCSRVNIDALNSQSSMNSNGLSSTVLTYYFAVKITAAGATVQFGTGGTFPTSLTLANLTVMQIPSGAP